VSLLESVKKLSNEYAKETVAVRRQLHAHPELSYQEYQTAKFVADKLKDLGLKPVEGIAGILQREGVVGNALLFRIGVVRRKQATSLKAGEYALPAHTSMAAASRGTMLPRRTGFERRQIRGSLPLN